MITVVREVGPGDESTVFDLERACHSVMRTPTSLSYRHAFSRSLLDHYANPDEDRYRMFGVFNMGGSVDGIVSIYQWKDFPYATIANLKVRPGLINPFSPDDNPMAMLFRRALQFLDAKGIHRWYFLRAADWPRDRAASRFQELVPGLARYTRVVEMVVPKNTEPSYGYAWAMMAKHTWPVDLAIECGTLRQEHRPTADLMTYETD